MIIIFFFTRGLTGSNDNKLDNLRLTTFALKVGDDLYAFFMRRRWKEPSKLRTENLKYASDYCSTRHAVVEENCTRKAPRKFIHILCRRFKIITNGHYHERSINLFSASSRNFGNILPTIKKLHAYSIYTVGITTVWHLPREPSTCYCLTKIYDGSIHTSFDLLFFSINCILNRNINYKA